MDLLEPRRLFAFGQTDPDFGVDGRARIGFPNSAFAAAAQDLFVVGGKMIAAGNAGMTRFNADGSLDSAFGTKGKATFSAFNYKAVATDISNRIFVLATASSGTVVTRYTADGKTDANFASGGTAVVSSTSTFTPACITIQSDGKILVAGTTRTDSGNGAEARVYRLLSNGNSDSAFSSDGVFDFNFGGASGLTPIHRDKVLGISARSNGTILVSGGTTAWAPSFNDPGTGQYFPPVYGQASFAIAKLTTAGELDGASAVTRSSYADEEAVESIGLNAILPTAYTVNGSGNVFLGAKGGDGAVVAKFDANAGSVQTTYSAENGSPLAQPTDIVAGAGRVFVVGSPKFGISSGLGVALATLNDAGGFSNIVLSGDNDASTPDVDPYYSPSPSAAVSSDNQLLIAGGGGEDYYNNYVVGKYSPGGLNAKRPDEFINARANDIARDSDGGLHVAYYDAAKNVLMYAYRGPNLLWNAPIVVDGKPNAGQYVSIDVTSKDKPGIAYFDGNNGDLKLAVSDGKKWTNYSVESKGSTGLYPSLQFDNTDRATMTYYKKTGGDLRFAVMNSPGVFGYETVESAGDVGRSNTLVASPKSGRYTVSYFDNTNNQVKWARHEKGGKWNIKVAAKASGGADFISMAYGYSYEPAISYYDAKGGDLKLSYYSANTQSFVVKSLATSGAQGLYGNMFFPSYYGQPSVFHYNRSQDKVVLLQDVIDANIRTGSTIDGVGRYLSLATDANGAATDLAYFDADANVLKVRPAPSADN